MNTLSLALARSWANDSAALTSFGAGGICFCSIPLAYLFEGARRERMGSFHAELCPEWRLKTAGGGRIALLSTWHLCISLPEVLKSGCISKGSAAHTAAIWPKLSG